MKIVEQEFGKFGDKEVYLITLTNDNDMQVSITNFGGIITKILVKDKHGILGDVTLGYDNFESYINNPPYFGAIIGRYANRIKNGKFALNSENYQLDINDGENHLHGGNIGFGKVLWDYQLFDETSNCGIILTYLSKDGEGGYPGDLNVEVIYTLTNENEIIIEYNATTDKTTHCNLTNHAYFNLRDGGKSSILDHKIKINAESFIPVNKNTIPFGDIYEVKETPFDFTSLKKIGQDIYSDDVQLKNAIGYDHTFILNGEKDELKEAAIAIDEISGRILKVFTTEPGLQFYTGNHLDDSLIGKNEVFYNHRNAFCLESQHFPDSPNRPNFPITILKPGEIYNSTTVYKFSLSK